MLSQILKLKESRLNLRLQNPKVDPIHCTQLGYFDLSQPLDGLPLKLDLRLNASLAVIREPIVVAVLPKAGCQLRILLQELVEVFFGKSFKFEVFVLRHGTR